MPEIKRLAVITGASAGLGALYARKLAAQGWDLLLVARRADRLTALAGELKSAFGADVQILNADLSLTEDVERVAAAIGGSGRVELLVNNAGFGTLGLYHQTDYARQVEMVNVHVLATMRLTRAALEAMIPRDRGAVINVASVAGFARSVGNVSYCATKGWMNDFTEGLALELRKMGSAVQVQSLCPGFTYTEFHDVLGVDRGTVPRHLWMPADFVVEESLRGLRDGKLFVIPSWKYRWFVNVWTRLPLWLRFWLQVKSPHKRA